MPTYHSIDDYSNQKIHFSKWSGLLSSGDSLSDEQTAEIIIKTNSWHKFYFNDDNDIAFLIKKIYFNHLPEEDQIDGPEQRLDIMKFYEIFRLNNLNINYLKNNLIYPRDDFAYGLWIDWDGNTIKKDNDVGKKCSVIDLLNDVRQIKKNFPYIKNLTFQFLRYESKTPIDNPVILTIKIFGNDIIFSTDDYKKVSSMVKKEKNSFTDLNNEEKIKHAFKLVYKIGMR